MSSAESMVAPSGRRYHLGATPGDVASSILLVGDPERAERAGERLEHVRYRSSHREFHIITGEHRGLPLSVVSVGIGAGAMEIAVLELCQLVECPSFLRAGTCGALQRGIRLGDLVVTQAAVRLETASLAYVEAGYPAFAHAEAQLALVQAAEENAATYHLGVTATAAGFYGAQERRVPGFEPREPGLLERLRRQGVLSLEMETSCLLTLAALRGLRAGSVCAVVADRSADTMIDESAMQAAQAQLITVGLDALWSLSSLEAERGARAHWHPGLRSLR